MGAAANKMHQVSLPFKVRPMTGTHTQWRVAMFLILGIVLPFLESANLSQFAN